MRRSRRGYVLAELVVAVFLTGVLMTVTSSLIIMCSRVNGGSHDFLVARQIASSQLETMRAVPFEALRCTEGEGDDFSSPLGEMLRGFAGTVRVEPFDENPALRAVTVTVRWQEKRLTRELSLSVLRGKRTP